MMGHDQKQTELAFAKLEKLREEFGNDVSTFKNINFESLERS